MGWVMIPEEACLLRVYVNASDRRQGEPVYQAVVTRARTLGMAGASVFPVELSYGSHRRLHDSASDYSFAELPVVVEVVDGPDMVARLRAELDTLVGEGLVTVSPVRVVRYGARQGDTRP